MNGLAALLALALAQEPPAAPEKAVPPAEVAPEPPEPPAGRPRGEPAGEPAEAPAPRAAPASEPPPEGAAPARPSRAPPPAAPAAGQTAVPQPVAPALPQPAAPKAAAPAAAAPSAGAPPATGARPPGTPAPAAPAPARAAPPTAAPTPATPTSPPERAQVATAAARFFDALLGRRVADLAALSSPSFGFEGRAARGVEDVRARWQEAVVGRDGASYALLDLEVLPAAEAVARFGKPPRRVAPLVQPGTWVAVANLSGRLTFVFLARQGGAWVATGLHD